MRNPWLVALPVLGTSLAGVLAGACASGQRPAGERPSCGLVYGERHAFWVCPPPGWVLDNESGVNQGLHAVFYPEGSSWKNSAAVMYVNSSARGAGTNVETAIAEDLARFRGVSPDVTMIADDPLETSDKKRAEVRRFAGDQWGNTETVAYIQEGYVFVLIVLTGRTRAAHDAARGAFADLVQSYEFMTDRVDIRK